jgi:hypothetical protein
MHVARSQVALSAFSVPKGPVWCLAPDVAARDMGERL